MKKIFIAIICGCFIALMSISSVFADLITDQTDPLGQLLINEAGTYTLIGGLRGTLLIDPGAGDVHLILDNFRIDGGESAGIVALSGDSLTITSAEHSANRIYGGGADRNIFAAVYSRVNTFFEGTGSLEILGSDRNAVFVENADLTFNGGQYDILSKGDGIATGGDAAGTLTFNDGLFMIRAGENSIEPAGNMVNNGGSIREGALDPVMQNAFYETDEGHLPNAEVEMLIFPEQDSGSTVSEASYLIAPGMNNGGGQPGMQNAYFQQDPGNGMQAWDDNSGLQPQSGGEAVQTQSAISGSTDTAGEIVYGMMTNSAAELEADYDNAVSYDVSETSQITISSSGTYVITGTSSDGNITVSKGTTGVVLVLEDLDLTSTAGATVSVNKNAEVQIIISGNVTLTDAENPDDENSTDEDVADAFDGAALKVKAGSVVYITGDGTLTINGDAKNGIKGGDESSIVIDGPTVKITAVNDGINSNYDLAILSGEVTVEAGDDAIHADHILTIGNEDGSGPTIRVTDCTEGIEATVVNIFGGDITINSSDDAVNAANGDGVYEGVLDYSINMTGGNVTITSQGDGLDSNGNINLIGGSAQISSETADGDAGIDYDGDLYISEDYQLNNNSGVSGADMMPGTVSGGFAQGGYSGNTNGAPDTGYSGGQNSFGPAQNGGGQNSDGPRQPGGRR